MEQRCLLTLNNNKRSGETGPKLTQKNIRHSTIVNQRDEDGKRKESGRRERRRREADLEVCVS